MINISKTLIAVPFIWLWTFEFVTTHGLVCVGGGGGGGERGTSSHVVMVFHKHGSESTVYCHAATVAWIDLYLRHIARHSLDVPYSQWHALLSQGVGLISLGNT